MGVLTIPNFVTKYFLNKVGSWICSSSIQHTEPSNRDSWHKVRGKSSLPMCSDKNATRKETRTQIKYLRPAQNKYICNWWNWGFFIKKIIL